MCAGEFLYSALCYVLFRVLETKINRKFGIFEICVGMHRSSYEKEFKVRTISGASLVALNVSSHAYMAHSPTEKQPVIFRGKADI